MVSLRLRLVLLAYVSGGTFISKKTANATFSTISDLYADYISPSWNGCFFGPISSEIEKSLNEAVAMDYFQERYWIRRGEPVHTAYILTRKGEVLAEKIFNDPFKLEEIGIPQHSLSEFCAEVLFFNTMDTHFSVAHSLYLDRVKYGTTNNKFSRTTESTEAEPPVPKILRISPLEATFDTLLNHYKESWNWIVSVDNFERINGEEKIALPYSIHSDSILDRYKYLHLTEGIIESRLSEVESLKDDEQISFLTNMATRSTLPRFSEKRIENLNKIIREYPDIPQYYVDKNKEKLLLMKTALNRIERDGYNHVYNDFIIKMADLSIELKDSDYSDRPHVLIDYKQNGVGKTVFQTVVPDEIKNAFNTQISEGTWNYGFVYHMSHFIQAAQNTLFVVKGHDEYMQRAGERVSS